MGEGNRGPIQFVGHVLAQILVGIYVIVDSLIAPLFRPLMRWLSNLNVVKTVEAGIGALPPYAVLILFLVPLAVEEVVKFYGLVLLGSGHVVSGLLLYIGAHVFAILVCERLFSAGKAKLLTIGWFARLFHWLMGYRDRLLAWFKGTGIYRRIQTLKQEARALFIRLKGRTKAVFGR